MMLVDDGSVLVFDLIQRLEGWCTLAEAAATLGVSKQGIHHMVGAGEFALSDLRKVGEHSAYLIRDTAVAEMAVTRARADAEAQRADAVAKAVKAERDLHHTVRAWLRTQGETARFDRPVTPDMVKRYYRAQQSGAVETPPVAPAEVVKTAKTPTKAAAAKTPAKAARRTRKTG